MVKKCVGFNTEGKQRCRISIGVQILTYVEFSAKFCVGLLITWLSLQTSTTVKRLEHLFWAVLRIHFHTFHICLQHSLDKEVDLIELNLFVCSRQNSLWLLSLRMFLSDIRWPCPRKLSSTATKSGRCMQSFLWLRRYDRVNKTFTTQWTDRVHAVHIYTYTNNLSV